MQNRRKHVRVPIRAQVTCVAQMCTVRGVTRNLSESGIQVELPELGRRENIQLTFRLPASDTIIDTFGSVVWHAENRQGIIFKQIGEQSRASIRNFAAEHKIEDC